MRAFWGKKKLEWSNCNNLEVRGLKCHVLNIGGQSASGWIVQGVKCIFSKDKSVAIGT
jgi:hypothetical protein